MASLIHAQRGEKRVLSIRCRAVRGVSVVELLVAITSLSVVMVGVASLLNASWQSYQNLVWQNKANSEARRALDDICDMIRMGGDDWDMNQFSKPSRTQIVVTGYDTSSIIGVVTNDISAVSYLFGPQSVSDGTNILARYQGNFGVDAAQYIDSIQFEYEYRQPSLPDTPTWQLWRASHLDALDPINHTYFYLVRTVYVQINIRILMSVTGASKDYTRTLTSAVTLRSPYDNTVPPATL